MITSRTGSRQPTKNRLLDAGVRLFSERGFRETTVGDLEAAVGLQPRRGAMYRHFPSKEALLQAALEKHVEAVAVGAAGAQLEELPTADPRAAATAFGRWVLAELDRERAIVRILEQDGDRLTELRDAFRHGLVDASYLTAVELIRRWLGGSPRRLDVEAIAVVVLGAIINYRRSAWTFAANPLEIDDERFLTAWADLCVATTEALRARNVGRERSQSRRSGSKAET